MKVITTLFALALLYSGGIANADAARNTREYNLENGLGLKGYDPVAVFPEGGGFFASAENMKRFQADPAKYEPSYGGWCAYGMAYGSKVDIQPHLVTLQGRRAHYFASARTKANFDRDVAGHESRADTFWKQISGENPRQ